MAHSVPLLSARRLRRLTLWTFLASTASVAALCAAAVIAAPSVSGLTVRVDRFAHAHHAAVLPLTDDSPLLREAIVATEDERFFHHGGLDLIGLLRAIPYDISHLSAAEGASTIQEQLAKILYLGGRDHSPWHKAVDMAAALRLGAGYSHRRVLADYLDVAYFGEGRYGAVAASEHYFQRSARRLDLAQASLLAGLVQAPSLYDPVRDPSAARRRQVDVLRSMIRNGYITTDAARAVLGRPLRLATGTELPALRNVPLSTGPPFNWAELTFAGLLLALAVCAAQLAKRLRNGRTGRLRILRLAPAPLIIAALFAAAHSIQVL